VFASWLTDTERSLITQASGRWYFVSTVGCDEEVIRNYIRNQEQEDQGLEQMNLWPLVVH
jgi:hypothetical protein